jgi:hypothetical protein
MSNHNKSTGPSGKVPKPGSGGFTGAGSPSENTDKIKNKDALQDIPQPKAPPATPTK